LRTGQPAHVFVGHTSDVNAVLAFGPENERIVSCSNGTSHSYHTHDTHDTHDAHDAHDTHDAHDAHDAHDTHALTD
jgi:hypothetical protein